MLGAVGIEHDPPIFKSRDLMALQPPTKFALQFLAVNPAMLNSKSTMNIFELPSRQELTVRDSRGKALIQYAQ